MKPISAARTIHAPVEQVFAVVSDVRNFAKAVPHILDIEFMTDQQHGAGTKFRETRDMNGKTASVVIEVAEYQENESVRMVSDEGGTIWDSVFRVEPKGEATELSLVMEVKPHKITAKMMVPLISGMVRKGVEADMDAVKEYCEK